MTEKKPFIESTVKNIRRNSKKKYSAEEKIRIVLEGLRGHVKSVGIHNIKLRMKVRMEKLVRGNFFQP